MASSRIATCVTRRNASNFEMGKVLTSGSGIGGETSMVAANHRCSTGKNLKPLTATAATVTTASIFHPKYASNHLKERGNCCFNFLNPQQKLLSSVKGDAASMDDEYGEMTSDGDSYVLPNPFKLESGQMLDEATLRYQTYGDLNDDRDNVLVVCHALTGNASLHSWWGGMLGPGRAFDTNKYFIVCANILGSCYGSTSPASVIPGRDGAQRYGMDFPDVSVQDTVRLQLLMLRDGLKINGIKCVIGGSFGGMQSVEYAVQAGTMESVFCIHDKNGLITPFVRSVIPIACGAAHTAWQIAISETQRQAIYADPKWKGGDVDFDDPPLDGLSVARMIGMVSYRTPVGYETKFGRDVQPHSGNLTSPYGKDALWQVKSYLAYQGQKFVTRFDPITYVKLTEQMDSHDVGRNRGGKKNALAAVEIPAMVLGIDSDILYPVYEQENLVKLLPKGELRIVTSDAGHDGFLLEQDQVAAHIENFLDAND